MEASVAVDTSSCVLTRVVVLTLVDVNGAVGSGESTTFADRTVGTLLAKASILARVWVTESAIVAAFTAQFWRAFAVIVVA